MLVYTCGYGRSARACHYRLKHSRREVDLTSWPRVKTEETSSFEPPNQSKRRLVPGDCLLDQ